MTRAMCCMRLVFSTSKKIARRVVGNGRSTSGGRAAPRAANAISGSASTTSNGGAGAAGATTSTLGGGGGGGGGAGGDATVRGVLDPRRVAVFRRLVLFLGWLVTSLRWPMRLEPTTDILRGPGERTCTPLGGGRMRPA